MHGKWIRLKVLANQGALLKLIDRRSGGSLETQLQWRGKLEQSPDDRLFPSSPPFDSHSSSFPTQQPTSIISLHIPITFCLFAIVSPFCHDLRSRFSRKCAAPSLSAFLFETGYLILFLNWKERLWRRLCCLQVCRRADMQLPLSSLHLSCTKSGKPR